MLHRLNKHRTALLISCPLRIFCKTGSKTLSVPSVGGLTEHVQYEKLIKYHPIAHMLTGSTQDISRHVTESRLTVVLDQDWALVGLKVCFWVVHVLHPGTGEQRQPCWLTGQATHRRHSQLELAGQRHFDKLLKTKTRVSARVSKQQHSRNLTLDITKTKLQRLTWFVGQKICSFFNCSINTQSVGALCSGETIHLKKQCKRL